MTAVARARRFNPACAALLSIALGACASMSTGTRHPAIPPPRAPADAPSASTPPAAPRPAAAIMVDNALSMLGQPYRYGGAEPGGFDCSGLVAYAAGGAGIRVPRTAIEQLRAGMPVARSDVRPGDLVFMHLSRKELHVGIAIGGERFVHAPAAGGRVRIDSLAAPPYAGGFTAARRFSGAQ
jgi:cell wall-associated NlpC family hydrolase